MSERVILAYSGGLDTSVILKWLTLRGYEVIAYIADVGQRDDFDAAKEKALRSGASKVRVEDLREEFVTDFIFPAFKANAMYEGRYLLGTALARPLIAKRQIEIAIAEGAPYVAHGATGKGNDQVRFELAYYALHPTIKVIAPWKDREFLAHFKGRTDLLEFAEAARDRGDRHGGEAVQRGRQPPPHLATRPGSWRTRSTRPGRTCTPGPRRRRRSRTRRAGSPSPSRTASRRGWRTSTTARCRLRPLELFQYLNEMGSAHGIGRVDMVENRFVGIKSRGVYETPGGTILHAAHLDIEGIAMDREVMQLRNMLTAKLSELIYNGFWFSPEMDFLMAAMDKSQEVIDGTVFLKLYKGNVMVVARDCSSSLYDQDLSSMDIEGGFNQQDAEGFIRINALRLMAHSAIMHKKHIHWGVD